MVERKDVEAAIEARRELGKEYEPDIVEAMVEKIEKRLDERLRERREPAPRHHYAEMRVVLGSIGLGVGATAIATGNHAAWLAVVAWIAIAVVNVAYAMRR
jgi:hypothetical protein